MPESYDCRMALKDAWSKEYREMEEDKLIEAVASYMKNWMMLRICGEQIIILPAVGRAAGSYPEDFKGGEAK